MVTGASDGIGREFALQLAGRGFSVVLVSRTQTKLDSVAQEVRRASASSAAGAPATRTVAIDFAHATDADYGRLESAIAGLDVAVLVNNVGVSHAMPVPFLDTPAAEMRDIVAVNCAATLAVTRLVGRQMLQRARRAGRRGGQRGLILTVASIGGVLPTPLLATYSGSKAFLQQWSSALGAELEPAGIRVHLLQSYLVTSAMSKIRRPSALVPTPRTFVRAALSKIGRSGGAQGIAYTGTPYWAHALMHWGLLTFVGTMNRFVVGRNKVMHEQIRTRALKKQALRDGKKSS